MKEHHAKNSHRDVVENVRQKQIEILKGMLKSRSYSNEVKSKIKEEFIQILNELTRKDINLNDTTI